jgi:ceramide kinase
LDDFICAFFSDKKTPKSLIVFVNPFGGEKKAMQVYERIAKPLFEMAGIEVNCVVSQRARQITDLIMSMRLDIYDGICCVGGDGTFSEVFNGLLQRESQDGAVTRPSLPIGIIPAGSTDTVAFCLHNTSDIQTCVLAIVLGSTRGLDLASVVGQNGMKKFYASMFSFGFLGDVAWDSENYRYLGKKRYDFSGFKIFLKNRGYSAKVAILLDEDANNASYRERCLENCQHCSKATKSEAESEVTLDDTKRWKTINGKFFMINVANISCACHRSKNGVAHAHLADGFLDITLVRHTGFWNNLRLLIALKAGEAVSWRFLKKFRKADRFFFQDRLPFVENFRARRFQFWKLDDEQSAKLNSSASSGDNSLANSTQQFDGHHFGNDGDVQQQALWNCDGEKVDCADCVVRSHLQLIRVFRRGGGCGGNNAAQTIALN